MALCSIHQPTFFPWLGYFDKIRRSDVFVFLDRAHYQKSGSSMNSWCNRVQVNVSGHGAWINAAVVREHGPQPIHTVRLDDTRPWRDTIRKTLETNYRKARHFPSAFAFIDGLLSHQTEFIADFNIHAITSIAKQLGVDTKYVRETALPEMASQGTERLVAITKAVGADTYMSGAGAKDYLDTAAFPAAGLTLVYQDFSPAPYGPAGTFIPGLSVIDYLMHRDA